jgi:hypothetical protein
MYYTRAVKASMAKSIKQQAINSAAETELGRQLTRQEVASFSTMFSLDEFYGNLQKVRFKI